MTSETFKPITAATLEIMSGVETNNMAKLRSGIDKGGDVNHDDARALRLAAAEGRDDAIVALLDAGADIHVFADKPLRVAVEKGHLRTVQLLVKRGADVNANDGDPLVEAVTLGHEEIAHVLIESGADVHVSQGHVLRQAVVQGDGILVSALLDAGADAFDMMIDPRLIGSGENFRLIAEMLETRRTALMEVFSVAIKSAAHHPDFMPKFLAHDMCGRGESALAFGVASGQAKEITEAMIKAEVGFTRDMLENAPSRHGVPLLRIAIEQNALADIFAPALWRGRNVEAIQVFEAIPAAWFESADTRMEQVNTVIAKHKQAVLLQKADKNKFKIL